MDVHVRDLRYFLAVARELSFTRAAETLYISQPALSKQIRALERHVGSLFDATTRVRLTRAGSELVPSPSGSRHWEGAKAALARASDSTLVIGMHTSPGRGLLPKVRASSSRLPRCHARVASGRLEPTAPPGSRSAHRRRLRLAPVAAAALPLGHDRARATTRRHGHRHPLASREQRVLADLLDEPFLALPRERRAAPRLLARARRSATATRLTSRPRSTTPRRPTRRSPAASACACSPPATRRSSPAATSPCCPSAT